MFQNIWFDRATKRLSVCTEDPSATSLEYSGRAATAEGDSAKRLRLPTLAETMRAERGSRVVSLALKARSAIMMAGHAGDAVVLDVRVDGQLANVVGVYPDACSRRVVLPRRQSDCWRLRPDMGADAA